MGEFPFEASEARRYPDLPVPHVGQRRLEDLEPASPLVPLLDTGQHRIDVHRNRPWSSWVNANQAFAYVSPEASRVDGDRGGVGV